MLIIMAGMPYSGKSVFAKKLAEHVSGQVRLVDPKDYVPPEAADQDDEMQRQFKIAAWNVCLEYVNNLLFEDNSNIIIFDTTAANYKQIHKLLVDAKLRKHSTLYIFLASSVEECRARAGNDWVGDEICNKYKHRFKQTVPEFKRIAHKTLIVKNDEKIGKLTDMAEKLATQINALH